MQVGYMVKQSKIERIEALKSEHSYLESKEAQRYIERIDQLYETPKSIVARINSQIQEDSTLFFPAEVSPLYGLMGVFKELNEHAEEFAGESGLDYPSEIIHAPIPLNFEYILGSENYTANPQGLADFLETPYRKIQFTEPPHIPELIHETLPEFIQAWNVHPTIAERMRRYVHVGIATTDLWERIEKEGINDGKADEMLQAIDEENYLFDLDYKKYFSPSYQAQEEQYWRSLIEAQEMPLLQRFKRIKQAKTLDDVTLRRELVTEWITQKQFNGFVEDLLNELESLKRTQECSISQSSINYLNNGDSIQQLALYRFLERTIQSDRKYVEEFLKH